MFNVYEVSLNVIFKKNIPANEALYRFSRLLNDSFGGNEELVKMHKAKEFKSYCYDNPFPLEPTKIYKESFTYRIRIRTINEKLFEHFRMELPGRSNNDFKIFSAFYDVIPKRPLESIRSITPPIIKIETGYWENTKGADYFLNALNNNMLRKYEFFTGQKIDRNKVFFYEAKLQEKPCKIIYKKDLNFLGKKVELLVKNDKLSQDIAYLATGVGICENNTAGTGFMEYQWVKKNKIKGVIK